MPDGSRRPLRIVLLTDVFPPKSGGSGWSTYYLGKALTELGNSVRVVRPRFDLPVTKVTLRKQEYGGLPVDEVLIPAAPSWASRAGLARAWQEREATGRLSALAAHLVGRDAIDVLHGQHKVSGMAASLAVRKPVSRNTGVIAVTTVRDYWPLCPVSTRLFVDRDGKPFECAECHRLAEYLRCVRAEKRDGVTGRALAPARYAATYRAGRLLAAGDATIAVSGYVAKEIIRSARVPAERVVTIPNLVDLPSVDRAISASWPLPDVSPDEPFAVFVGKWDINKGAWMLPEIIQRSGVTMPVLLLGDGPLAADIARDTAHRRLDFRFYPWLDNDAVLRVMHSARILLFPSAWQEPLSRVLLEGCAAGAAIVALDTGGTSDIIVHKSSGWLAQNKDQFVEGVQALADDDALNLMLRRGARDRAEQVFAAPKVAAEVDALYRRLLVTKGKGAL
ncbi:MAG: glycosyltransferase family 4 protein [Chloroflexota bacterium]